jgi:hypothetical protein
MRTVVTFLIALFVATPAFANERHFTYTYESAVLAPGELELEPWTTLRAGRDNYYHRYDLRLEFEYGVVDALQTALYWNFTALAEDVDDGAGNEVRETGFEFSGVSSEWKYRVSDAVADPIGSALYLEGTVGPTEAEIEAKVILDKRFGDLLVAFNAVAEYEWEFAEPGETERELVLAPVLGVGYFVTTRLLAGIELRNHNDFSDGSDFEHSAFFAGPVLAYAGQNWWTAFTLLPQIGAIGADDGSLDLEGHERVEARLLLGFHMGDG